MKVWHFLLTIIITATVVGGGMYVWQQSQFESLNEAIEDLQSENENLKDEMSSVKEVEDEEETSQLLTLDSESSVCTEDPSTVSLDIGRTYTVYPVADEYETSADDFHNIAGLFTAAACGEERVNELFGSRTFNDVAIFTNDPSTDLIDYLKNNDFVCYDEEVPDSDCSRWYNSGSIPLEVMAGLRVWSEMIYGSDCTNCG